jgi:hypothetical protein
MDSGGRGRNKSKTKDTRIVGFVDSRQLFPGNGASNVCWYFLTSPVVACLA